ncbi:hypothetical protein [Halopseudomonas sp.]|uniref:hypothetical protein n=1 Tax=Halopseudomonas sp. TaxID=2901191 RepID=UPI0039E3C75D
MQGGSMLTEAQFNRSTLECMTILRRRLKQELGITVRLSQEGAATEMIRLSATSTQEDLRELGQRLSGMVAEEPERPLEVAFGQGAIAARQRHMQVSVPPESAQAHVPKGPSAVRIYRGQVVRY